MKKALREKVIVKNKKKMDVIMMKPILSIARYISNLTSKSRYRKN
jgi:hypothetical protein